MNSKLYKGLLNILLKSFKSYFRFIILKSTKSYEKIDESYSCKNIKRKYLKIQIRNFNSDNSKYSVFSFLSQKF